MNILINVIAFKVGWVSAVLGGANDLPLVGTGVVLAAIAIHLLVVAKPSREANADLACWPDWTLLR